tara:strand:+ start:1678 stop:2022 length:345 start_codon:yes stop_codon:yes gene_type:complete
MVDAGLRDLGPKVIKTQAVNLASAGAEDETAITAVPGKKIVVINLFLVVSAATSIGFKSGAGTALTGLPSLAVKSIYNPGYNPDGHFQTASGEALVIACGAATDVDGWINYYEE